MLEEIARLAKAVVEQELGQKFPADFEIVVYDGKEPYAKGSKLYFPKALADDGAMVIAELASALPYILVKEVSPDEKDRAESLVGTFKPLAWTSGLIQRHSRLITMSYYDGLRVPSLDEQCRSEGLLLQGFPEEHTEPIASYGLQGAANILTGTVLASVVGAHFVWQLKRKDFQMLARAEKPWESPMIGWNARSEKDMRSLRAAHSSLSKTISEKYRSNPAARTVLQNSLESWAAHYTK